MSKKLVVVAVVFVLVLSALTGCGSNNNNNNKDNANNNKTSNGNSAEPKIEGKITFATNRTDMVGKELDEYAKRFHEKYPDASVEFEAIGGDYNNTIKVRMSSGELPDIQFIPQIPNTDLPKYFTPLDDLGLNGKIYFENMKTDGGKMYGISTGASTVGIVYNKKAFEKAGITKTPATWDEFLAACDALKSKGIVPLASNFKDKWPLGSWAYDFPRVIAGDATFPNEKLTTDDAFTMDNAYGKTFSLLRDLNEKGYLEKDINSTNWEQSKKDLANGKFGMYLLGNWVINQVIGAGAASEDVGFFPFPYDNSGKIVAPLSPDWFYAVNKDSKHVETAKAFVKWMIEESGYEDFAGLIPTLKDREPKLAQLAEFKGYNPEMQEAVADDPKVNEISNKAQVDIPAMVQEFVLAKDPQKVFDKWNKAWAKARKAVGN